MGGSQGGELELPYRWQMRVQRWKNAMRGFFGGGDDQPRPKLCPACGSLVGISAKRCHECGTSMTFSLAAMSKGLSEFFGGHAPVTTAILIVNIVMFVLSWVATIKEGGGSGSHYHSRGTFKYGDEKNVRSHAFHGLRSGHRLSQRRRDLTAARSARSG